MVTLGLVAGAASRAQGPAPARAPADDPSAQFSERLDVVVATVLVHIHALPSASRPPSTSDLEVLEDGTPRRVLAVEALLGGSGIDDRADSRPGTTAPPDGTDSTERPAPLAAAGPGAEIYVYADREMAGYSAMRNIARTMGPALAELAKAAPVTVVAGDPEPRTLVTSSRDARVIRRAIEELAARAPPRASVEAHRSGILRARGAFSTHGGLTRAFASEEEVLISRARVRLLDWISSLPRSAAARLLFLIGGSFDSDPTDFYLGLVGQDPAKGIDLTLVGDLRRLAQNEADQELGQLLAESGWTVYPIAPVDVGFPEFGSASENGHSRWLAFALGSAAGTGPPPFLFSDPGGSWRPAATESGGQLVRTAKDFAAARRRLGETYRVSYERPGLPAGHRYRLEVRRVADGARLEAPAWQREGTPELLRTLRARQAEQHPDERGGMVVAADLLSASAARRGERDVRIRLRCRPQVTTLPLSPVLAVALALFDRDQGVTVRSARAEAPTGELTLALKVPADAVRVGVAVEDPATGLWGTAAIRLEAPRP